MTLHIYLKQAISEELHNSTTWLVILFTILLPFVGSFIVKERYRKPVRCIGLLAFSLYGIYAMTLLDRMDSGASKLNFDLFWTWERALAGSALHQYFIVGNVLLFVPFGVAVTAMFARDKRRWWKAMLIGMVTSVVIEGIQYAGHLGLCEMDDVVHNTLGMMVGYGIVRVWGVVNRKE